MKELTVAVSDTVTIAAEPEASMVVIAVAPVVGVEPETVKVLPSVGV